MYQSKNFSIRYILKRYVIMPVLQRRLLAQRFNKEEAEMNKLFCIIYRIICFVVLFNIALTVSVSAQTTRKCAIQTVNGNYLTAVNGGGIFGNGALHTDATKIDAWEQFKLIPLSNGKYAIQTIKGNYLTAVNGGGVFGLAAIHTDATKIDGWEVFTLQNLGGNIYAIQTMNGNYLTALNGGGIGGGEVTIHTDATKIDAWEKFRLIMLVSCQIYNVC